MPPRAFDAEVVRVVDGDTFVAVVRGKRVRVRLIGVDTPETVKPGSAPACFGREASTFTTRLLDGVRVRAAYQPGGRADRYKRQLWDVWLPDGRFAAGVLVSAGVARPYPYRPQVAHAALLRRLGDEARAQGRGLWGAPCQGNSFSGPAPR